MSRWQDSDTVFILIGFRNRRSGGRTDRPAAELFNLVVDEILQMPTFENKAESPWWKGLIFFRPSLCLLPLRGAGNPVRNA